jgi:hypothetical protein
MFPFLTGRRAVRITRLRLFIEAKHRACPGSQFCVNVVSPALGHEHRQHAEEEREDEFTCVVTDDREGPATFCGEVDVDFGPIGDSEGRGFGCLRFGDEVVMSGVQEAYMLCEWVVGAGGVVRLI